MTSRDAKKRRTSHVVRHRAASSDRYVDQEHFETNQCTTSGPKAMAQPMVSMFLATLNLTFDLCSIFHTHCA